jgi:hypothetical protein
MAEQTKSDAYREEFIRQAISLAAFMVTLIAYQATIDPTFRELWTARFRRAFGKGPARDREAEAMAQVQREISWMEHGVPEAFTNGC